MYFTREGYLAAPLATTPPRGGQLNFLAHAYYDVTVLQKHSSVYFQTHPPIPLNAVADLHSKILDARPPPWGSKFFQFHAVFGKIGKIVCWRPPPPWGVGAPSSGKS